MDKFESYISAWRKRLKEESLKKSRRKRLLRESAKKCTRILKTKYGVSKVYLIGSCTKKRKIHDKSDIDLVVKGLKPKLYISALSDLWELLPPGVELDLIPLEDSFHGIKKRITTEGELLYEK